MLVNMFEKPVVTALYAGLLTACGGQSLPDDSDPESLEVRNFAGTDQVRIDDEFVAELDSPVTTCPDVGSSWLVTPMVHASPHLATKWATWATTPEVFRRFCRYKWNSTAQITAADRALVLGHGGFTAVNAAYMAVSGEANILTERVAPELRAAAEWRYRAVTADDLAGSNANRTPVFLAIVDTEPPELPTQGSLSPHGRAMVAYARGVACPEGMSPCAVTVEPVVGLPRLPSGAADYTTGGFVGTAADVSTGVLEAVERWKEFTATTPDAPLVISLSLGLDTTLFTDIDASQSALYHALRYASCYGATLIASSGNEVGHDTAGPLAPAMLEAVAEPTPAECAADFGVTRTAPTALYRPLVHGVGGLDYVGITPVTRVNSLPRLVAAATHVPTPDLQRVMTGTSVATALTSGAAALALSYAPDYESADLMKRIYDASVPLGQMKAKHYFGPVEPDIHPMLVCNALVAACFGQATDACDDLDLTCDFGEPPEDDIMDQLLEGAMPVEVQLAATPQDCATTTDELVTTYLSTDLNASCDDVARNPYEGLSQPQPPDHACSTCGFEVATGITTMALVEDFAEGTSRMASPTSVDITMVDGNGDDVVFQLGAMDLHVDSETWRTIPNEVIPDVVQSATVTLHFAERRSTEDTLIVR